MTQGKDLLSKIIQENNLSYFHRIPISWFVEDELRLHQGISAHIGRFGNLPSVQALLQAGYPIEIDQPETLAYYVECLHNRHKGSALSNLLGTLRSGVNEYAVESLPNIVDTLARAVKGIDSAIDVISLAQASRDVLAFSTDFRNLGRRGITTGYPNLDEILGGWWDSDVNLILGRPGQGKTSKMQYCSMAALKDRKKVLFLSMELSIEQMTQRFLGMWTGYNPNILKRAEVPSMALPDLTSAILDFEDLPTYHLKSCNYDFTTKDIEVLIKDLDVDILFLDSVYLVKPYKSKAYKQSEIAADVSKQIKSVNLETNIPIIATSQLNRQADYDFKMKKKIPDMGNIAETDQWSRDASNIFVIVSAKDDPVSQSERSIYQIKGRDGSAKPYKMRYSFQPPNFEFMENIEPEAEMTGNAISRLSNNQQVVSANWSP